MGSQKINVDLFNNLNQPKPEKEHLGDSPLQKSPLSAVCCPSALPVRAGSDALTTRRPEAFLSLSWVC